MVIQILQNLNFKTNKQTNTLDKGEIFKLKNNLNKVFSEIQSYASQVSSIQKIILFGSRARGDNNRLSDIDIAVYTDNMSVTDKSDFTDFIHLQVKTLLEFDIIFIDCNTDEVLQYEIEKDGIIKY